jgi:hypothetical protein
MVLWQMSLYDKLTKIFNRRIWPCLAMIPNVLNKFLIIMDWQNICEYIYIYIYIYIIYIYIE